MIVVNLDVMMAKRKMSLSQLSEKVDITLANLSILKNNKAKAVPFLHAGGHLRRPGLPAGRHSGVRAGRRGGTMTARRTAPPRQERACICRPRIFPAGGAALPAHVLQRRLAGSGIGPPAGVDPCVLLPLVSLGLRLRSRADRGRWDPVYCGTSSADCIRAAVSLPICPGRPPGPLRYLITPFRILLLMLTR